MPITSEQLKKHRKLLFIGMFLFSILVNGCFFPIINLNPDNPVNLSIVLHLVVLSMTFVFHKSMGTFQAILMPQWSVGLVGLFNTSMILCGLFFRYILEFGEVSNCYNFTLPNILFQVISLSLVSTIVYAQARKKN